MDRENIEELLALDETMPLSDEEAEKAAGGITLRQLEEIAAELEAAGGLTQERRSKLAKIRNCMKNDMRLW